MIYRTLLWFKLFFIRRAPGLFGKRGAADLGKLVIEFLSVPMPYRQGVLSSLEQRTPAYHLIQAVGFAVAWDMAFPTEWDEARLRMVMRDNGVPGAVEDLPGNVYSMLSLCGYRLNGPPQRREVA